MLEFPSDRESILKKLNEGVCPFCEEKGFKIVFKHINKKHGILSDEIKDYLLIPRGVGFCDAETKEKLRSNFNISNIKGRPVGYKKTNIALEKERLAWLKNTDRQNRVKNMMKDPEIKARNIKSRVQNGLSKLNSQKAIAAVYGTIEGYPDENYIGFAIEFINELNKSGGLLVYNRLGNKWGISRTSANKRINVAVKRGLLNRVGSRGVLRAELTIKANRIIAR